MPAGQGAVLMPAAKKLAAEKNVSLGNVAGTGRGGRITKGDVIAASTIKKIQPDESVGKPPIIENNVKGRA